MIEDINKALSKIKVEFGLQNIECFIPDHSFSYHFKIGDKIIDTEIVSAFWLLHFLNCQRCKTNFLTSIKILTEVR